MMKHRTLFFMAIGLLILAIGIVIFTFSTRWQMTEQIFPATVNLDCAPWDGAAFTVSIPHDSGSTIRVSLWKSPDIQFPVAFSFPDDTGQIGIAVYQSTPDEYKPLNGNVSFSRVNQESPVEGTFDLKDENGNQFKGKFKAEWGDQIIMCG